MPASRSFTGHMPALIQSSRDMQEVLLLQVLRGD
ncbi:UNVERIFIED_ORG: hypothetical protein ABIB52_004207 [Arthrobacter sp. UYCu721]